jgi:hypothetical protein
MSLPLLLVFLVCFLTAAGAQEVTNEDCLACHGMEDFTDTEGRSIFVNAERFDASIHGAFSCTDCHTDATDVPHAEKLQQVDPDTCAVCHEEVAATYRQSIHGEAHAQGISEAATCTSCHGSPHEIRQVRDPASPVYHLNLPRTCGVCHGDPELAKRYGISVPNAYQLYMDSIHGRAVARSGLLVAANCSNCHGSHDIRPRSDPASKVARGNVPTTCGACHAGTLADYLKGIHGQAFEAGLTAAPVCIDCHTAHEVARVDTAPWNLGVVKECGTCHPESLKTYRDTFHGQVTSLGFTRVARCADCHGSHRILPASDPASSIAPQNLVATCQKCHPRASANFARFSPHADPHDKEKSPSLYYTALFMNTLMLGVFAFFGLHTALWLFRSMLEMARQRRPWGEQEGPDHDGEETRNGSTEP